MTETFPYINPLHLYKKIAMLIFRLHAKNSLKLIPHLRAAPVINTSRWMTQTEMKRNTLFTLISMLVILGDNSFLCFKQIIHGFHQWCRRGRCVPVGSKGYQDVDGNWGAWKPWSSCYPRCGEGLSVRVRECDNPA